jgi:ABC-type transport system substrate-binding protein
VLSVTSNGDELMVAIDETVDEVIARLPGSVLTVATNGFSWTYPPPDPPLNGNWDVRQALYLTCANLFNYPDLAGPQGLVLQPEVASSVDVSADAKTYTFTIGPNFQFSPPSKERVSAETFVHTIERAVNPLLGDNESGPQLFGDIVGVKEFREGQATFVSGLKADGDQLRITLNQPVPDFLNRLATSYACAVPIHGTPVLRSGLNPNPPVSGAGPYYVAEKVRKQLVVLKKNPNYHGTRPQPFDEIAILQQVSPTDAIAKVASGQLDSASFDCCDPISGPGSALADEWGPAGPHAASGDQHWFAGARPWLDFLVLNPNRAPFDDPDVRRAVALALNRTNLAKIWAEVPTSQLLVPSLLGTDPERPVGAPDIDAAKALMGGRTFNITMIGCPQDWDCGPYPDFEAEVTTQLNKIGINVTVRHPPGQDFPGEGVFEGRGDADLLNWGIGADFPEAASLLGQMRDIAWIGKSNIDELTRLQGLSGQPRADGAAAIGRTLVDQDHFVLPVGYHVFPFFTSERIGCGFVQDAVGAVDLLSLCVEDGGSAASPSPTP